jgi:hypothetical protein
MNNLIMNDASVIPHAQNANNEVNVTGSSLQKVPVAQSLLDPGFDLTLRPMRYPRFYEMYRAAIKNTWTVEEIDFQIDLGHLRQRMTPADRHLIERIVAFFATGDSIVSNNLVISLYRHINAPEARMYLSRQLYEEALHIQFYLTLLDNYVPDQTRRAQAFAAIDTIPSIKRKAEFCQKWTDEVYALGKIVTHTPTSDVSCLTSPALPLASKGYSSLVPLHTSTSYAREVYCPV